MVQFLPGMGQNSSLPKPGRRKSLRSFRKSNHRNNNLSHTFTLNDSDDRIELLNINQATEEELMTLPGVSREIAKSIVEHRKAIGRFRKVEDLALVRGIGATKLEHVRPEICVATRRNHSCPSSRAQSYDSLRSTDSRLTVKSNRLININRASVFELQCVHGITQEIAAAIVHYRDKKGPFKQVEDLVKVRSIDRIRLDNISRSLTVDNSGDESSTDQNGRDPVEDDKPNVLTNGFHVPSTNNGDVGNNRRANGGPPSKLPISNGFPSSSLLDIFELLSAYSPRPILEEVFGFSRNGEPAIRAASWNLHGFSYEKAHNPGVREVICRTILENGFSIIAVQDVLSVSALKIICDELNRPRLRRVSEWRDKNHNWNFCMLDIEGAQLGFIYDSDGAVDIELSSLTRGPDETRKDCEVLIASFKVGELQLQLVNMMMTKSARLENLHGKVKDLVSEEDMLLLFADISKVSGFSDNWSNLGGLRAALPSTTTTSYTKFDAPNQISNILYNSKVQGQLTSINGVVRKGLTHLAIPNGWNWGGPASPHSPIWTELFLSPSQGTAL